MRTLFITQHYLHVPGGAAFATTAFVNAFAEISEYVTFLFPAIKADLNFSLNVKIKQVPITYQKPKLIKLYNIYRGKIHRFENAFYEEVKKGKYDVIVFDNCIASYNLVQPAKSMGFKVIVIHHNYQVEITKDNMPWYVRPPMLHWVEKAEKYAVSNADLNLTLTQQDAQSLRFHYYSKAKIEVLGVFESERKELVRVSEHIKEHNYIISGNLSVKQTVDSLYPWIRKYYPVLLKCDPHAKLTIAGKSPQKKLYKITSGKNIEIIASPKTMEDILKKMDYYICPTGLGSGIKLRIMDGLKAGMPVLTHKNSSRGYDEFVGKSVFTYTDIDSFCDGIKSITSCKLRQFEIQNEYWKFFSFEKGLERLKKIIYEMKIE